MEPLTLEGKRIEFTAISGELAGCQKRSDSYVSGGGGGGNGNYTAPVHVSTTVVVQQEFHIRRTDGTEEPYKLTALDIPVRDGQQVTMVSATIDHAFFSPVRLVNFTSGKFWPVNPSRRVAGEFRMVMSGGKIALATIGIWIVGSFMPVTTLFVLAGIGFAIYQWLRTRRVVAALDAHFDQVARSVLAAQVQSPRSPFDLPAPQRARS